MKSIRLSAVVMAAAVVPTALMSSFASPATAAERVQPTAFSAPDAAVPGSVPSAEEDRIAIFRILADKNSGKAVHREAQKALAGTDQDMRYFLEVGQYKARTEDDRVQVFQILHKGGPEVRAAAEAALEKDTPEALRHFIEVGQHAARFQDDRVLAAQIHSVGGPAVKAAARAALTKNTPEALRHFIEVGQHEARAKDKANEKKGTAKATASIADVKKIVAKEKKSVVKDKKSAAKGAKSGAKHARAK